MGEAGPLQAQIKATTTGEQRQRAQPRRAALRHQLSGIKARIVDRMDRLQVGAGLGKGLAGP